MKKGRKYDNQLLLGASRFGVDYQRRVLVPLDISGERISFSDFVEDRKGRLSIAMDKRQFLGKRFAPADEVTNTRPALPARVFEGPFVDDALFLRQANRRRKQNGFLLLDHATIARIEDQVLPRVLINGKHWEADGCKGVLHDPVNWGTQMRFPFDDDYQFDEGSEYHCDRWMMYPYKGGHGFIDDFYWKDHLDVPVNTMLVKMLEVGYIDPVGHAEGKRQLPGMYLYDRPYRDYHKATPVSWTKAYFSDIVNETRRDAGLPPLPESAFRINIQKESDQPKQQMKRGKGI